MAHGYRNAATVDPTDFTPSQWREVFYCSELIPRQFGNCSGDSHEEAKPFDATCDDIAQAALCCRNKAEGLEDGTSVLCSPGDDDVDEEEWADELNEAAAVLEGYLVCICGEPRPCEHSDQPERPRGCPRCKSWCGVNGCSVCEGDSGEVCSKCENANLDRADAETEARNG